MSKEEFVKRAMRDLADRESERKERDALYIINEPCAYYCNKSFRGKKNTKRAYQC